MEKLFSVIGRLFIKIYKGIGVFGEFIVFVWNLIPLFFSLPIRANLIFNQIYVVGVGSVGVISLTSIFTGMVEAIQLYNGFHKFGAENFIGYTIFVSIAKELGPVFASLMLISRAISAMAAELGTMRVTEQIDAIDTLAIDSRKYLIVPRVIACVVSLPFLIILFDFMSNVSAYFISINVLDINATAYVDTIQKLLLLSDIYSGIIKGVFFGLIVGLIGTYVGYFTTGGARGVGVSTTKAVVVSAVSVFCANYFISSFFLFIGW